MTRLLSKHGLELVRLSFALQTDRPTGWVYCLFVCFIAAAQVLSCMQRKFGADYTFVPKTWVLPVESEELRAANEEAMKKGEHCASCGPSRSRHKQPNKQTNKPPCSSEHCRVDIVGPTVLFRVMTSGSRV